MRERYHLWLGLQEKRSIKALGLQLWEHIGGERELVKAYAFSGGWGHNGGRRGLVDEYESSGGWISTL